MVDEIMENHNTPYYPVGAGAVALEFLKNGIKPARGTRDIDFAIMTAGYDVYRSICKFATQYGFRGRDFPYEYDLISGNVTRVVFNRGQPDQFYHRYIYDEDNRIKEAQTSDNGIVWESDARYSYYKHGPLKRMELGKDKVQGLDYVYTIQGWLKAINHPSLAKENDPGGDGTINAAAGDAFGMILTYYQGDFINENSVFHNEAASIHEVQPLDSRNLYNGNIAAWTHRTAHSAPNGQFEKGKLMGQQFVYDKLNRIKESRFNELVNNAWQPQDNFHSNYAYDAIGNITHLQRSSNQGSTLMDDLTYRS